MPGAFVAGASVAAPLLLASERSKKRFFCMLMVTISGKSDLGCSDRLVYSEAYISASMRVLNSRRKLTHALFTEFKFVKFSEQLIEPIGPEIYLKSMKIPTISK